MSTGLSISREYFDLVWPSLQEKLGEDIASSLAVGLVGEGSECFGFDDAFSRDHDWGPGLCLWLPSAVLAEHEAKVRAALSELPREHAGRPVMLGEDGLGRRGPLPVEGFYSRFLGRPSLPETWQEWRRIPEHFLAVCTNGEVFMDNLGEFTRWRKALQAFYPEDVRLKKIACRLAVMAQAGQYNLQRSMRRNASVTAMFAAARFGEQACSLVYLLNKRYAPFYKWMHRGLDDMPGLGEKVRDFLNSLAGTDFSQGASSADRTTALVEELCTAVVEELFNLGLSDAGGSWLMDHAAAVQEKIDVPELRRMPVLSE